MAIGKAGMLASALVMATACARPMIQPAVTDGNLRPIDEPCNAANAVLAGPTRSMAFDPAEFPVPARWLPYFKSLNDLDFDLQKSGAVLNVWKGSEFIFKPVLPINTTECELARGDTTIKIRTTMLVQGITNYRVDVSWKPLIGGQNMYMQLQTRFPEHLKQIRGVIDGVRFPVRAALGR